MGERTLDCAPLARRGKYPLMNQSPSLFGTPREWAIDLAIMTAVGAFLGVIGPIGTFYGGPIELRVALWVGNSWVGLVVLSSAVRLSLRLSRRLELPIWFGLAVGVAVGSLPLALITDLFSMAIWPPSHGRFSPLFPQYAQVLFIAEPVTLAYYFVAYRGWRAASRQAQARRPSRTTGSARVSARASLTVCRRTLDAICFACRWRTTSCAPTPRAALTSC